MEVAIQVHNIKITFYETSKYTKYIEEFL